MSPSAIKATREQNSMYRRLRYVERNVAIRYQDAGHGGLFQHHADFVTRARSFLDA